MKHCIILSGIVIICLLPLNACSGSRPSAPPQAAGESVNSDASKSEKEPPKQEMMLDVPLIKQNPELKYGCEVTSLAMLLQHVGVATDKMRLADELPKDGDPVRQSGTGDITHWGDPEDGFVGDITGRTKGYAVYNKPMEQLMKSYLPDRTLNLTGQSFDDVLRQLQTGKPVVVWTTGDYKLPDRWESWKHGEEEIKTPLDLHAVVLVGYNATHVFINDPLTGKKAHPVPKQMFADSWIALGKQALTYR